MSKTELATRNRKRLEPLCRDAGHRGHPRLVRLVQRGLSPPEVAGGVKKREDRPGVQSPRPL